VCSELERQRQGGADERTRSANGQAARMVQSRLSAHIRPHAGGSSGLGGMRQWRQSESASATYGNPYLDLSGSPLSHHRPGDHAPLASASGLELGGDAGASASWNKTRALDMDLDAQGGEASFAQELAQVEHVPCPPHCPAPRPPLPTSAQQCCAHVAGVRPLSARADHDSCMTHDAACTLRGMCGMRLGGVTRRNATSQRRMCGRRCSS